MIEFKRPGLLPKTPKNVRRIRVAFNRETVADPAMAFTHHIEVHGWIGRLYFGGVLFYWNVDYNGFPTSDSFALYSSRCYSKGKA